MGWKGRTAHARSCRIASHRTHGRSSFGAWRRGGTPSGAGLGSADEKPRDTSWRDEPKKSRTTYANEPRAAVTALRDRRLLRAVLHCELAARGLNAAR
jgi:hypothetical protein